MPEKPSSGLSAATAPALEVRPAGGPAISIFAKPSMEREIEAHVAAAAAAAPAVGFIVPTTLQGSTPHFHVYYQTGFANGPAIARLRSCR